MKPLCGAALLLLLCAAACAQQDCECPHPSVRPAPPCPTGLPRPVTPSLAGPLAFRRPRSRPGWAHLLRAAPQNGAPSPPGPLAGGEGPPRGREGEEGAGAPGLRAPLSPAGGAQQPRGKGPSGAKGVLAFLEGRVGGEVGSGGVRAPHTRPAPCGEGRLCLSSPPAEQRVAVPPGRRAAFPRVPPPSQPRFASSVHLREEQACHQLQGDQRRLLVRLGGLRRLCELQHS